MIGTTVLDNFIDFDSFLVFFISNWLWIFIIHQFDKENVISSNKMKLCSNTALAVSYILFYIIYFSDFTFPLSFKFNY